MSERRPFSEEWPELEVEVEEPYGPVRIWLGEDLVYTRPTEPREDGYTAAILAAGAAIADRRAAAILMEEMEAWGGLISAFADPDDPGDEGGDE